MVDTTEEKLEFLDTWKIQPLSLPLGEAEASPFFTVIAPTGAVLVMVPALVVEPAEIFPGKSLTKMKLP